jgi:transcription elongation GreA/GreB family factor
MQNQLASTTVQVSQRCFEQILSQMVYLEEVGDNIADWVDVSLPGERQDFLARARIYKSTLEELITNLQVVDAPCTNQLPIMLVYARAKVETVSNNEQLQLRLVPPYRGSKPRSGQNLLTASLLSPWGKALLLHSPGDHVAVTTLAGQKLYRILDIQY